MKGIDIEDIDENLGLFNDDSFEEVNPNQNNGEQNNGGQNNEENNAENEGPNVNVQPPVNENDLFYAEQNEVQQEAGEELYSGIIDEVNQLETFEDLTNEAEALKEEQKKKKEEELEKNKMVANADKMIKDAQKEEEAKAEKNYTAGGDKVKVKQVVEVDGKKVVKTVSASRKGLALMDAEAELRGYKDTDFDEGILANQADKVYVMKHTLDKIFSSKKHSAAQKKVIKDLNEFDKFMREIDGRTRLSPREMEIYDELSLKTYRSQKEYLEYKAEQKEKRMEAFDEKNKKKDKKAEYEDKPEDIAKVQGVTEMMENIQRLREETFKKAVEEKTKELTEKCKAEAEKIESQREQLLKATSPEDAKNLQKNMEDSIAKTLFYNNRIEKLKEQGELNIKPDEKLTNCIARLEKSAEPSPEDLANVKKTDLFKNITQRAMDMHKQGETLLNEDIAEMQKEYIAAEGSKKAMQQWREKHMNPIKKEAPKNDAEKKKEMNNQMKK